MFANSIGGRKKTVEFEEPQKPQGLPLIPPSFQPQIREARQLTSVAYPTPFTGQQVAAAKSRSLLGAIKREFNETIEDFQRVTDKPIKFAASFLVLAVVIIAVPHISLVVEQGHEHQSS